MQLYDYARAYLGVPFKYRGRDARGLDCAGLVWCSYRDAGIELPDLKRYGREPGRLGQLMGTVREAALSGPVWEGRCDVESARIAIQPGDVLVLSFEIEPHHLAIAAPNARHGLGIIHADGMLGTRKVIEVGMIDWHFDKVVAVFRRPV